MEKSGMSASELRDLNARIRALHDNLTTPGTAGEG
jgi:hypothetical protein